jgi:site-specific recombinase XerD
MTTLEGEARRYLDRSKADNTKRAYRADWQDFTAWCEVHGRASLPAEGETLALYLTDRAKTHKTSSLQRRLTAIGQAHQAKGYEPPSNSPTVRAVWQGSSESREPHRKGRTPR